MPVTRDDVLDSITELHMSWSEYCEQHGFTLTVLLHENGQSLFDLDVSFSGHGLVIQKLYKDLIIGAATIDFIAGVLENLLMPFVGYHPQMPLQPDWPQD